MMKISGLAYVVAETTDMAKWKGYAEGVLGMMTAPAADGGMYVRMDERQFRFAVQPGERNAYVVSGAPGCTAKRNCRSSMRKYMPPSAAGAVIMPSTPSA